MKIGAYVISKTAKANYASECYNVRAWPGFETILDVLRRGGIEFEYCSVVNAHKYDVVLYSITSDCDWWPFVAERVKWLKRDTRVIIGGPGVLNVRPFLPFAYAFVFGRGEDIILPLIKAEESNERFRHSSVCYSDEFKISDRYEISQAKECYAYPVTMANGKPFNEQSIGCPGKCLFCAYTWHRKYIGGGGFTAGQDSMSSGNRERTIIDLLKLAPQEWQTEGPLRIVGLDGTSERLRKMVNKKISRAMWQQFLRGLATIAPPHQVKVYNLVGLPTETANDWHEFKEDISSVDNSLLVGKQWSILCHFTPFRPMPATPSAIWPISYEDYRGKIAGSLKQGKSMTGNIFFQGNRFWAVEGMGTDSLPTVFQSAICLRGDELDSDNIVKLSLAHKYWSASRFHKVATLEQLFNAANLFKGYTWDTLPTRYLHSYSSLAAITKQSQLHTSGFTDKK